MPDLISSFKASPSTTFVLGADRLTQNEDGNYTTVRCYIRAINGPGGSTGSAFYGPGTHEGVVDGVAVFGRQTGNPFLPPGVGNGATRWQHVGDINIGHGSDGRRGAVTMRQILSYGNVSEQLTAAFNDFPRIAKPPSRPATPTISNVTSSSIQINGSAPADNGGAGVLEYQHQAATNTAFTAGVVTGSHIGPVYNLGGLTPGQRYYARYRARNRRGWSAWSTGTPNAFVGLPAPTLDSWAQDAFGRLVASWEAPSITTGLTGYRLQVARDAAFTSGVQNIDLGNVLTHAVAGLAGGRNWYARVAALTAGGVNAYSAARSALLVLAAGDLDGWTRLGALPAGMAAFTAEGIRRGTVEGRQALLVENLANAAATLPAGVGIQRTVTGLTIGSAYRFQASAQLTDAALATQYRLVVVGEGSTAPVAVTAALTPLGTFEFVADATTVQLQLQLAAAVNVPGPTDAVERVAFTGIRLLELATDYPVRLRETVYESNLANHFDLACNSAGASWYVAKDGITRFRLPGAALPVSAVFTDEPGAGALHYIDAQAAYDTRGMVNRLDVTNYGVAADRATEQNDELIVVDQPSIDAYGVRSSRLEVNLWGVDPYDDSLSERLTALLDAAAEPRLFVSSLRWNAQENLAAANALEVGQRLTVRFNGTEQDSQIVSLQHEVTPRRWIVTITLRRL